MKRLPKKTAFEGIILLGLVMLAGCASTPTAESVPGFSPGSYQNTEYGFTVEFPDHYILQNTERDEVFRVANPNAFKIPVFTVNITDPEADAALNSATYLESVEKAAPKSKRFRILSEEKVTLNDGTPGLALVFKYVYSDGVTKLQTASLWVLKDGKSIAANATTILGGDTTPNKLLGMVKSLKFN